MAIVAQPSPLSPAWQRARALADSGDLAGARAVLERAAELGKVNLSEDDPDVLQTAYLLAGIHQRADDPSAARRVLEDAYAAGQWRLGDADPLMVQISHDIGVVAEELGNRHEARKAFGRVAEFGPSVLGPQHRAVARARAYLGEEQNPSVRAEAAPSTPYDTPHPVPEQRTAQMGATPAVFEEPAPTTNVFGAVPRAPGPGLVEPPSPANQQVWTGPATTPERPNPIDEATVVHPVIVPRAAPVAPPPPVEATWPQPVEATWTYAKEQEPSRPYEKRGIGIFAAIAAVLAAVIAVAALVFVLANRGDDQPSDPNVPTLGGKEPTSVRLRDEGSKIGITWQDPTAGTVSFLVAMGHPGSSSSRWPRSDLDRRPTRWAR